ncbi:hypothetical protein SAMN05661099_0549 [Daejeonella lutea]|uniref:Uncharacterized protein n=1 Tax=Daejeonella lutea TaxID=572036 RepID=A0A1T5ABG6_9SPHI|nr:hypothetical protein SAMN05661099_0549 [Daejeonella lutea]
MVIVAAVLLADPIFQVGLSFNQGSSGTSYLEAGKQLILHMQIKGIELPS